VQFCPCLNQSPLFLWQISREQLHRINLIDGYLILVPGVKVRYMVGRTWLGEHADNYSEKAAEFRHT
jgi:hypothetical protein